MKTSFLAFAVTALLPVAASGVEPQPSGTRQHVMAKASQLQWGEAPPSLPPGVQAAVLSGNPAEPGAFAIRLKAASDYRIPRHWHPTDEEVTVIDGELTLSMGEAADAHSSMFGTGDYVLLPAHMQHEATFAAGTVVQVHSTGPFEVNYVDPDDDPRQQADDADATP